MANIVEVIVRGKDELSGTLKGASGALEGLSAVALKVGGGIAGVGALLDQAFDLGAEGAAITQTRESFDLLLQKVNAAPDLFRSLTLAADSTVSEMQLMSSVSTLVAGASGDMGTALVNSTPRLLEIARAAQKLNPSLGDTTFLFDSLAKGIKRGSPLILDNLGIVINQNEAYKEYATQLGRTAASLDVGEQKMALLNATLEAGSTLIDQVGGNVDSGTDDFSRLDVAVEELANKFKEALAPGLADAAEGAVTIFDGLGMVGDAVEDNTLRTVRLAASWEEYSLKAAMAGGRLQLLTQDQFNSIRSSQRQEDILAGLESQTDGWLQAMRGAPDVVSGWEEAMLRGASATAEAAEAIDGVNAGLGFTMDTFSELSNETLGREALDALNTYTDTLIESGEFNRQEYASSVREIADTFDLDLSPAMLDGMIRLSELKLRFGEVSSSSELASFLSILQDINSEISIMSQWTGPNFDQGAGAGQFPVNDAGAAGGGFAGGGYQGAP